MSGSASRRLITKRTRMQQVEGLVDLWLTHKSFRQRIWVALARAAVCSRHLLAAEGRRCCMQSAALHAGAATPSSMGKEGAGAPGRTPFRG